MNDLPTLYGLSSNNKVKQWTVTTDGADVVITHGQVGGKLAQMRTTSKSKNIGKANETSPSEQAILEAQSKWNKQIKKDYRESIEDIPKSTLPNLAHKYQDKAHTVDWDNTYELVKLDGVRCSVFKKDGEVVFQSRGGEHYPVIQEIADELQEHIFQIMPNAYVDGEMYLHSMYLEDITACIKKHNEDTKNIEFHIFDLVNLDNSEESWLKRYRGYTNLLENANTKRVKYCYAEPIYSEEEMLEKHLYYTGKLYEGIILRNTNELYKFGNRTLGIVKYKEAESEEFEVVGFECDKNGAGVPIYKYIKPNGVEDTFKAPFATTADKRKQLWINRGKLIGKYITVDFEKLSKYGKPTKPISKAFRDVDEEGNPLN